jgi:hypothetical protein
MQALQTAGAAVVLRLETFGGIEDEVMRTETDAA